MSKMSKVKSGKSTKSDDHVLGKIKSGGVTKSAGNLKSEVKTSVKKQKREEKKPVKAPTPPESEDDNSSDDSASDSEVEKPVLNGKSKAVNGNTNGVKAPIKNDSDSSDSESDSEDEGPKTNGAKAQPVSSVGAAASDSDDSDADSDDSDADSDADSDDSESDDEKPAVSAVMGAKVAPSDADSSDESDSEDEKPASKQPLKTNGIAKKEPADDSDDSSDSDSDEEVPATKAAPKANGVNTEVKAKSSDDDDSASDSDSSDESEEEKEVKPKSNKRKADDAAPERANKIAKAEEAANGSNLFVGNLSWNVTEDWLKEEFEVFGELSGVRIVNDRESGRSKGFGYVEFVNAADAAKAHAEKSGYELDGRALNVDFANNKPSDKQRSENRSKAYGDKPNPPSDTIFVGNLPFSADADMVTEAFEPHGTIQSVRLPTEQESQRPRGFGYVTYASVEEATVAFEAMQGFYLDGRPLRLDYSQPRPDNGDSPRGGFGGGRGRGGFGGRGRGRGDFNSRGGDRGGRGGGFRGGRGGPRGGRGGSTNRGGFGDFAGKKTTF